MTTSRRQSRCPKCQGRLCLEEDEGGRYNLPPEWVCLQCGWRRAYTPRQFTRVFALAVEEELAEASA